MANFFLCYECGATFSVRNDFDEHILVHQAVSLCYQIYEFDKGKPPPVKVLFFYYRETGNILSLPSIPHHFVIICILFISLFETLLITYRHSITG